MVSLRELVGFVGDTVSLWLRVSNDVVDDGDKILLSLRGLRDDVRVGVGTSTHVKTARIPPSTTEPRTVN